MTQKEKVLKYMQDHGCITTRDAGIKLNVWDLQAIVYALKADGYNIVDEWVTSKKSNTSFKLYALKPQHILYYKRENVGILK